MTSIENRENFLESEINDKVNEKLITELKDSFYPLTGHDQRIGTACERIITCIGENSNTINNFKKFSEISRDKSVEIDYHHARIIILGFENLAEKSYKISSGDKSFCADIIDNSIKIINFLIENKNQEEAKEEMGRINSFINNLFTNVNNKIESIRGEGLESFKSYLEERIGKIEKEIKPDTEKKKFRLFKKNKTEQK